MAAKNEQQFIKVTLTDQGQSPEEQVGEAAIVLLNKRHIVSAMFNIATAALTVETTSSILHGGNRATMVPKMTVQTQADKKGKKQPRLVQMPNSYREFDEWQLSAEPASIVVTVREEIIEIWNTLYPGDKFDLFEKHEALVQKLKEAREKAEAEAKEKADLEALNLTKADGQTPLNEDTVDEVAPILGMDGKPISSQD